MRLFFKLLVAIAALCYAHFNAENRVLFYPEENEYSPCFNGLEEDCPYGLF